MFPLFSRPFSNVINHCISFAPVKIESKDGYAFLEFLRNQFTNVHMQSLLPKSIALNVADNELEYISKMSANKDKRPMEN